MSESKVDMRQYTRFPEPPRTGYEIYNYQGDAWKLACAMAGKYDAQQYNAYRALYFAMQDDSRYRTALAVTLDILRQSRNIRSRAGFIYSQLAAELSLAGGRAWSPLDPGTSK